MNQEQMKQYLDETHICEEVPGVPDEERYFLWHDRRVIWKGPTKDAGYAYAAEYGIKVDAFYPFEP